MGKKHDDLVHRKIIVVAVKASQDVKTTALVWALTHVVQPSDQILFVVVVVSSRSAGRKNWGFPRFSGNCANAYRNSKTSGRTSNLESNIQDSCSQMITQLPKIYNLDKTNFKLKIVPGSPCGAVAAESKRVQASWVVMDKQLKNEEKKCMEELQCNIVVMKHSQPKILRLNLAGKPDTEPIAISPHSVLDKASSKLAVDHPSSTEDSILTHSDSPLVGTPYATVEGGSTSQSSSDPGTSPLHASKLKGSSVQEATIIQKETVYTDLSSSESDIESSGSLATSKFQPSGAQILSVDLKPTFQVEQLSEKLNKLVHPLTHKALMYKFLDLDLKAGSSTMNHKSVPDSNRNIRESIMTLLRNAPLGHPPLCSICKNKAPVFGKPPKSFSYAELSLATDGFSQSNFLAEGGFGSVHRGILPDGQVVAIKQHKLASSQGDDEFCSEVEVLSCAQHRNVVMLIGFCVEDNRRLLVYEFICNGSLDSHLYDSSQRPLDWCARQKIAVGAARGLRYLHEECRVGCIIHRDVRPNNILITHDFDALVGDFGLARWQPDGNLAVKTRVIGTFGYLAPEYAQSGQVTEKADVYSFGIVLLELVTGRRAVDINRPKGQQCLAEWARPILKEYAIQDLLDPRLRNIYCNHEVFCMLHAASLCINREPNSRPHISQVLRILEGDIFMEQTYASTPLAIKIKGLGSHKQINNSNGFTATMLSNLG
ncbi:inactive protein kinase SELMODRAFT_444075 isoform X2 [Dendrobium catenatum]|uniref:Inactive protein kinase n=1 Tax=Dendrobium catenatum TaxID=906689 RepID=A0A2I0VUI1_9ASPA|nr:inactive protein kinase SELMODRAFT_444075 isoform X2 [Dendrobium catenatum]PKU67065.1 Inactive protein kinase [Dendrobium catenatum]